ncbi:hypothetical protein RHAB21_04048 [Pseudorhizobium halotolerans]|uniref:Uncharacterized protein n=1 Tax=Pseudorhizobium halotolerans TaxID=1233081 RepID=A0ABN7JZP8_9HYPH|nr:hypothetical protein [Pseudorhizobium halotolerans]CAD7049513.1 hypothetical protein RHAB21_04048 [Pseudorhizobium halotolerans]
MSAFSKSTLSLSAAVLALSMSLSAPAIAQVPSTPAEVTAAIEAAVARNASDDEIAEIVRVAILANPAAEDDILEAALAAAPDTAADEIAAAAEAAGSEGTGAGGGGAGGGGAGGGDGSDPGEDGIAPNPASPT